MLTHADQYILLFNAMMSKYLENGDVQFKIGKEFIEFQGQNLPKLMELFEEISDVDFDTTFLRAYLLSEIYALTS